MPHVSQRSVWNGRRPGAAFLAACVLAAACAILASCRGERAQGVDSTVNIGALGLRMHKEGKGTPAIVFDAGVTDGVDRVLPFQRILARKTLVISYDRAGYGKSDPGPYPRDGAREADELKAMLDKSGVPGPYVLVGHSLGALNVMIYASKHPRDVKALVLLDPPPLSFILRREYRSLATLADSLTASWQAVADTTTGVTAPAEKARLEFFRTIASEQREMFGATAKEVAAIASLDAIPLVVVASGMPNPQYGTIADEYQKYWIEQSRELSTRSTRGTFVLAPGAGHYIYLDAPDLVIRTISSQLK